MKYQCNECKDRGVIILLTSVVDCDCQAHRAKQPEAEMPHWVAAYDSYGQHVAQLDRAS